ncbi:hypothetical protein ACLKA7_001632 [Drosophila subpalustris]
MSERQDNTSRSRSQSQSTPTESPAPPVTEEQEAPSSSNSSSTAAIGADATGGDMGSDAVNDQERDKESTHGDSYDD